MTAELPKTIQVGPLTYTLVPDKRLMDAHNAWSYIEHARQTITYDPDQQPDHQSVTMLHEVLHACWLAGNLKAFEGDEEKTVTALAPTLLDTLRRNPDLVAYLLNREP